MTRRSVDQVKQHPSQVGLFLDLAWLERTTQIRPGLDFNLTSSSIVRPNREACRPTHKETNVIGSERAESSSHELAVMLTFHMAGPDEQQTFLKAYRPVVEEFVSDWPGFLGATLYASTDGTRVINHTRWADEAAYRDYLERSDPAPRLQAIQTALSSVAGLRGPDMQLVSK